MALHHLLKKLREEQSLSQAEVADALGISRPTYIAVEAGDREPTLSEADTLARIFDISLDDLLAGKLDRPAVVIEHQSITPIKAKAQERISIPQEKADKFKKVLLYVLSKVGGKPNVGQTVLYKLLYFIDFDFYEKFETQLIGARYMKNTHGPTPIAFKKILEELERDGKVETIKSKFYKYDQTKYLVNPSSPIDLTGLSGAEIAHIDWELNRLSDMTASQLSALSHKDTPWAVAGEKDILEYEHVFYRPEETSVREYGDL
jgi:transcriptional regulator with XRE-family HTH domain